MIAHTIILISPTASTVLQQANDYRTLTTLKCFPWTVIHLHNLGLKIKIVSSTLFSMHGAEHSSRLGEEHFRF